VDQSTLMLAARITLAHFSVSSRMSLPKSAGEPHLGRQEPASHRGERIASRSRSGRIQARRREGDFWRHPEDARDFSIQPPSGKSGRRVRAQISEANLSGRQRERKKTKLIALAQAAHAAG
jgi:hypothetical protein